ncbi:glutathione S-transferase theta-1a [Aulostomus maculatus]
MELYLDLHSQPCCCVFLFARAVGIHFEFKHVDLLAGQQYGEEFGRISVIRKVPVMRDEGFVLTESVAILQYLAQKHKVADHWYPVELQRRARVDEFLSWQHTNLRAHGSKVFLLRTLFPVVMDADVPEEKMDAAVEDLNRSLHLLEEKFLQDKPFLVGDKISLADLVAAMGIVPPLAIGLDVLAGRPKLAAWRERVKSEVGEKHFDEAHEKIMKASSLREALESSNRLELLKLQLRKLFV